MLEKIIFFGIVMCALFISETNSIEGNLSPRKKRYVVFPEGSSFSIALCMTIHTLTPDNIFTEGLNWGISYDLPNESKADLEPFLQLRKDNFMFNKYKESNNKQVYDEKYSDYYKPDAMSWNKEGKYYALPGGKKYYTKANNNYLQRRHRRDLYNKLEVIINAMGYDGRSCILRALCEASQRFMPKGNSMVEEMMRIVFALPLKRVFSFEPEEHHTYARAHKAGHEGQNCASSFPGCSFSLIDMALGKYNVPDAAGELDHPDQVSELTGTLDAETADGLPPDLRYSMK